MDETKFLQLVLHATDQRSHAGPGIEYKHTHHADSYAWIARAERSGHVRVANGRATITDLGRQRLVELTGQPLYPIPKFTKD
jgi:hypothetical protein